MIHGTRYSQRDFLAFSVSLTWRPDVGRQTPEIALKRCSHVVRFRVPAVLGLVAQRRYGRSSHARNATQKNDVNNPALLLGLSDKDEEDDDWHQFLAVAADGSSFL